MRIARVLNPARFRRLTSREDLRAFLASYVRQTRETVSPEALDHIVGESLARGDVVALFDAVGRMIGGFAVLPAVHGRWPRRVDPRAVPDFDEHVRHSVELNCVWLEPAARGTSAAFRLWLEIGRRVGRSATPRVTFSVETSRRGLLELYRPIIRGRLYEGPFAGVPGTYRVHWSTPGDFRRIPRLYFRALLARLVGRARRPS